MVIQDSLGFCSVFSDIFFVVTYTCLSLVLPIDSCYSELIFFVSYLKKTKRNKLKKPMKYSQKKEFINALNKGKGAPLLNFERSPGVPL